jgi:hypothetical protein
MTAGSHEVRRGLIESVAKFLAYSPAIAARVCSAEAKGWGSSFPRFAARRKIPEQAFGLKKYRCGTSPVSKMSDNEHTAASLWHSEMLSVKNPVGEPIPAFRQAAEEGAKRPSSVDGQNAGDILPNQPAGAKPLSQPYKLKCEVAALVSKSLAKSGD